jgi:hypothetical protein
MPDGRILDGSPRYGLIKKYCNVCRAQTGKCKARCEFHGLNRTAEPEEIAAAIESMCRECESSGLPCGIDCHLAPYRLTRTEPASSEPAPSPSNPASSEVWERHQRLIGRIIKGTGEPEKRRLWESLARKHSDYEINIALAKLERTKSWKRITNPGAYFAAVLRRAGEHFV